MTICIFPLLYKDKGKRIGIKNWLDQETKNRLRDCGILMYSKTYGVWYLPYSGAVFARLKQTFSDLQIISNDSDCVRTEVVSFHYTDIASSSAVCDKQLSVEETMLSETADSWSDLRIVVHEERKGWWVNCDIETGRRLKIAVQKAVWNNKRKQWFVPLFKGNFVALREVLGVEVPSLWTSSKAIEHLDAIVAKTESGESVGFGVTSNEVCFEELPALEVGDSSLQNEEVARLTEESDKKAVSSILLKNKKAIVAPNSHRDLSDLHVFVHEENKGWWVSCDYGIGRKLKMGVRKVVWNSDRKHWFVPACKGNFAALKEILGVEVPTLTFGERLVVRKEAYIRWSESMPDYALVELPYRAAAYEVIKTTKTRLYNKAQKCWRILNQASIRDGLIARLTAVGIATQIDAAVLERTVPEGSYGMVVENEAWISVLPAAFRDVFADYTDELMLRQYSWHTIKNYRSALREYCAAFGWQPLDGIAPQQAQKWLVRQVKEGWSESSLVNMVCALRFYYVQIKQQKNWEVHLPFPRKSERLPNVLSVGEVRQIFAAVQNLKHKVMLLLGYAAGLRVSEVVHLQLKDIDSSRMVINVRMGKGKKDRCVMLSEVLLEHLRLYYKAYRPKLWLFEGQHNDCYSVRSVQKIFQVAREKTGIRKTVSFHSLRHSFATHLHESGTDIRVIQELLGHNDSRTTERYTHVSNRTIQRVKSPLDNL